MTNKLWLIWKEPISRRRFTIGLLEKNEKGFFFSYLNPELDEARKNGFLFFPGFDDLNKKYFSSDLFVNISTRLPNRKRPDYLEILNSYDLDSTSTNFEILKATKGRLLTDNYEFVSIFNLNKIEFDVAGMRHAKDLSQCQNDLKENSSLLLEKEKDNLQDEYAIRILFQKGQKKYHIGYVPRYYSKPLSEALDQSISYSAMIEKIRIDRILNEDNIVIEVKLIFQNKD